MESKGIFYSLLAAVIFALAPIIIGITYNYGNTPIMMAFFRGFLVLPVLFYSMASRGVSLRISVREGIHLLFLGFFGGALTSILLYSSYQYIPVGVATALHFIFPVVVTLVNSIYLRSWPRRQRVIALGLATFSMFILPNFHEASNIKGVLLALGSGVSYAVYVLHYDMSVMKKMDTVKLTFYTSMANAIFIFFYAQANQEWNLNLSPKVYILALVAAVFTVVFGTIFIQMGIQYIGPSIASILLTFEPVVSILLSVPMLGEALTGRKILACTLITISIYMLYQESKIIENT